MKKFSIISFLVLSIICGIWYFDEVPPLTQNCAFCNTEIIQDQVFYEDQHVKGLLSYKPVYSGHSLVIPQRHVERFEDLTSDEIYSMMALIKKIHHAHQYLNGKCAYFLLQKNGREVGQTVPHVHFHYIPKALGAYKHIPTIWNMFIAGPFMRPLDKETLRKKSTIIHNTLTQLNMPIL